MDELLDNEPYKVYRRYSDGYVVRSMTLPDIPIINNWYRDIPISHVDLLVAISSYPQNTDGFYVGEMDGEIVACALRIRWGENIFFGSNYYVKKEFRRKGYGTRLRDEVAAEKVFTNYLCVDSVQSGSVVETNRKLGYEDSGWKLGSFRGVASKHISNISPYSEGTILQASEVPFEDILKYDNKVFISSNWPERKKFLTTWFALPGGATWVARDCCGEVVGFGSRTPSGSDDGLHFIGPLYANSPEIAEALMNSLFDGIEGRDVILRIPYPNTAAHSLMNKLNFNNIKDFLRMHLNGDPGECKNTTYALTSRTCGF